MNRALVSISAHQDTVARLRHAVLIYGSGSAAHATIHDVAEVEGRAVIQPGKAARTNTSLALAHALARTAPPGYIPPELLYEDPERMVWWVAAEKRRITFRNDALGAPVRSEIVPHPALVFAAGGSQRWAVWALARNRRPDPATRLYRSPYFNVWADGVICTGNVELPPFARRDAIAAWNRAFFDSAFTHPNLGPKEGNLVNYKGGGFAFWRAVLDGEFDRFPTKVLVPTKLRLHSLLPNGGAYA